MAASAPEVTADTATLSEREDGLSQPRREQGNSPQAPGSRHAHRKAQSSGRPPRSRGGLTHPSRRAWQGYGEHPTKSGPGHKLEGGGSGDLGAAGVMPCRWRGGIQTWWRSDLACRLLSAGYRVRWGRTRGGGLAPRCSGRPGSTESTARAALQCWPRRRKCPHWCISSPDGGGFTR